MSLNAAFSKLVQTDVVKPIVAYLKTKKSSTIVTVDELMDVIQIERPKTSRSSGSTKVVDTELRCEHIFKRGERENMRCEKQKKEGYNLCTTHIPKDSAKSSTTSSSRNSGTAQRRGTRSKQTITGDIIEDFDDNPMENSLFIHVPTKHVYSEENTPNGMIYVPFFTKGEDGLYRPLTDEESKDATNRGFYPYSDILKDYKEADKKNNLSESDEDGSYYIEKHLFEKTLEFLNDHLES